RLEGRSTACRPARRPRFAYPPRSDARSGTVHAGRPASRRSAVIKVSVMYPNAPGARFDHDYYRDKHMPLVKARMGDACKYYTVDKVIAGGAPGQPATYVGMCH